MRNCLKHFVNGEWIEGDGGRRHEVVNPATELPCTVITLASASDVENAVAAARDAFAYWSQSGVGARISLLERIIAEYQRRLPHLAEAMSEEMGAPHGLALGAQAPAGLAHFAATLDALASFPFEERLGRSTVVHEPIGVVAMITPWNWPMNQICAKVAPALAAGNTMILKPSEEAPTCALILAEILAAAGTPPGVFNLLNGDGPGAGAALVAHPDVDMISFTGSTRAGVAISTAAAPTVKRVHLELGGKAANLVLEGADLATVLPPTVEGVLANSGQSCIAPTRILVHKSQASEATRIVRSIFEGVRIGSPDDPSSHLGPVVNRAQFEKIQGLLRSAMEEGATLVTGGCDRPVGYPLGFYVRPTLFKDVTPAMRIAQEEVFGPVATIMVYEDEDEAISIANDTGFGLSASISGDPGRAAELARRLRVGMVTINSWSPDAAAPFGGYKQSGNGREYGKYGLAEFMEVKSIVHGPA